eukprot:3476930-Prymnesium_polylepis.1
MVISDDDAFIHPHRLALDLAEWSWTPHLVYGTLSWAAGWDDRSMEHYGYGNRPVDVAGELVRRWRSRQAASSNATAATALHQGPY